MEKQKVKTIGIRENNDYDKIQQYEIMENNKNIYSDFYGKHINSLVGKVLGSVILFITGGLLLRAEWLITTFVVTVAVVALVETGVNAIKSITGNKDFPRLGKVVKFINLPIKKMKSYIAKKAQKDCKRLGFDYNHKTFVQSKNYQLIKKHLVEIIEGDATLSYYDLIINGEEVFSKDIRRYEIPVTTIDSYIKLNSEIKQIDNKVKQQQQELAEQLSNSNIKFSNFSMDDLKTARNFLSYLNNMRKEQKKLYSSEYLKRGYNIYCLMLEAADKQEIINSNVEINGPVKTITMPNR